MKFITEDCSVETVMKYFILFLVICFSASSLFPSDLIKIMDTTGKVEVKEPGKSWKKAFSGSYIPQGTIISTGFRSEIKLDLGNSSTIHIQQLSRMSVDKLEIKKETVKTKLNLNLGRIKAEVKTSEGLKHDFKLITPVSTAAVRGTVFKASASGDLKVESGKIKFTNKIGQGTSVRGGNSSKIKGKGYDPPEAENNSNNENFSTEISTFPEDEIPLQETTQSDAPFSGYIIFNWEKPALTAE